MIIFSNAVKNTYLSGALLRAKVIPNIEKIRSRSSQLFRDFHNLWIGPNIRIQDIARFPAIRIYLLILGIQDAG